MRHDDKGPYVRVSSAGRTYPQSVAGRHGTPSSLLSMFVPGAARVTRRRAGPAAPPRVDVAAHLVERLARVLRMQGRRCLGGSLADGPVWKSKFYGALVLNRRRTG